MILRHYHLQPDVCVCARVCVCLCVSAEVTVKSAGGGSRTYPTFPGAWRDEARWAKGLKEATQGTAWLSETISSVDAIMTDVRKQAEAVQGVLVDGTAWFFTVLASAVRDACVHPRGGGAAGGKPRKCDMTMEHLAKQLGTNDAERDTPPSTLKQCLRWLKPRLPQPPPCVRAGDTLLTQKETNRAWCERLEYQSEPLQPPPADRVHRVNELLPAPGESPSSTWMRTSRSTSLPNRGHQCSAGLGRIAINASRFGPQGSAAVPSRRVAEADLADAALVWPRRIGSKTGHLGSRHSSCHLQEGSGNFDRELPLEFRQSPNGAHAGVDALKATDSASAWAPRARAERALPRALPQVPPLLDPP